MDLGARNEAFDTRFFGFHRDLAPAAIAHLLDGKIVWRDERQGEWAAVLHFNRPQVANLSTPRDRRDGAGRDIIPEPRSPQNYTRWGFSPGIQRALILLLR